MAFKRNKTETRSGTWTLYTEKGQVYENQNLQEILQACMGLATFAILISPGSLSRLSLAAQMTRGWENEKGKHMGKVLIN